jgi:hypothetical protein
MAVMGVIGALVLLLIYFVVRAQALQKETSQLKRHLKSSDTTYKFTHGALLLISKELEKSCLAKLHSANKHGVMSASDFEFANFMVGSMEFVVVQCCERRATVEEAIKKSLKANHMDFDSLCQFIAKQPTEIRIPWCKNNLSGYIVACQNISQAKIPTKTSTADVGEKEAC